MRTKTHAVVGDFAEIGEAEDLVTAGISEDGAAPGHERMQATEFADQGMSGTKVKMVGVGENEFSRQESRALPE